MLKILDFFKSKTVCTEKVVKNVGQKMQRICQAKSSITEKVVKNIGSKIS